MRFFNIPLFLIVVVGMTGTATSQADQPGNEAERRKIVSEIIQILNLSKLVEQQVSGVVSLLQNQASMVVVEANVPLAQRDKATNILVAELATLNRKLHASTMEATIRAYTTAFTLSELKELLAFYQTPTGHKLATELPKLQAEGMKNGNQEGQRLAQVAMCDAFAKFKKESISASTPPFCK